MDLHHLTDEPTDDERAAVDALLGPHLENGVSGREARSRRHLLLPALHAAADRVGWVSRGALGYICRRLTVPPAEAFGVVSFYDLLSTDQLPPLTVRICDDVACMAAGCDALIRDVEKRFGPEGAVNSGAAWLRSPCLGLCEQAPAALFTAAGLQPHIRALAPATLSSIETVLANPAAVVPDRPCTLPQDGEPQLRLLRRIGHGDPLDLAAYRGAGGYSALARAFDLGPDGVIREILASKLIGRGGAAFPAGRKWEAVAREPERPHYVVCNADESEPGTFKDRVLMEEDPFAIIEAMTIAAFAIGSEQGYIYIRGEYGRALERIAAAIAAARDGGLLGADVMNRGLRFDVEVRRGAGAYICGEETALFNSIEGFRGEPRNKPPFPVRKGLFGKPTVINNVETLVNVLDIVTGGGAAYAAIGTPDAAGTKLFCVSGHVARPGLYEVTFGTTLRALIDRAGGVRGGGTLQAVLVGGAAGAFVLPDELDAPLTFAGMREVKATLGSGVVIVFDETVDLAAIVRRIARFFRHESCGQCVPCRIGTVRQEESLDRLALASGTSVDDEMRLLREIGQVMRDASICGLGQTASSAVESALAKIPVFGAWRRA
ncbi:MAG TPA: NADH-ubiquinone oxidoreductase-F iron-sulfur binding region domain-containing protein [Candidatus Eremiobacteraceae bacterium]|nr:NADH-ubiquinone oxidoreductase-F iron-sulfur binding region domain-containing protein [Candidatus Eremiobacteraceae bacterium]